MALHIHSRDAPPIALRASALILQEQLSKFAAMTRLKKSRKASRLQDKANWWTSSTRLRQASSCQPLTTTTSSRLSKLLPLTSRSNRSQQNKASQTSMQKGTLRKKRPTKSKERRLQMRAKEARKRDRAADSTSKRIRKTINLWVPEQQQALCIHDSYKHPARVSINSKVNAYKCFTITLYLGNLIWKFNNLLFYKTLKLRRAGRACLFSKTILCQASRNLHSTSVTYDLGRIDTLSLIMIGGQRPEKWGARPGRCEYFINKANQNAMKLGRVHWRKPSVSMMADCFAFCWIIFYMIIMLTVYTLGNIRWNNIVEAINGFFF